MYNFFYLEFNTIYKRLQRLAYSSLMDYQQFMLNKNQYDCANFVLAYLESYVAYTSHDLHKPEHMK